MKAMQKDATGIIGLLFSWYSAFAGLVTFDKIVMSCSMAASIMTFIYYYRKNKKL